jgi:cytochrome c-type biogenesis protein CcmE
MNENMMFFIDVSKVVAGDYPADRNFRVGGLVVDGSVRREAGSLEMQFRVTDLRCELVVRYSGVLPDLFREGQGVVAHGRIGANGNFVADTILAKHDENYMAPEVAESLAKHVSEQTAGLAQGSGECDTP